MEKYEVVLAKQMCVLDSYFSLRVAPITGIFGEPFSGKRKLLSDISERMPLQSLQTEIVNDVWRQKFTNIEPENNSYFIEVCSNILKLKHKQIVQREILSWLCNSVKFNFIFIDEPARGLGQQAQAKFADILIRLYKEKASHKIIFTSSSPHLMRRFLRRIAEHSLSLNEISLISAEECKYKNIKVNEFGKIVKNGEFLYASSENEDIFAIEEAQLKWNT